MGFARCRHGETPLMMAAVSGGTAALEVLLDAGAAVWAQDCEGRTAVSLAQECGNAFPRQQVLYMLALLLDESESNQSRALLQLMTRMANAYAQAMSSSLCLSRACVHPLICR